MDWLTGIEQLRDRHEPGVLVTVAAVRGHAPREAGAKMVVGPERTWGTVGGGALEAAAIDRARSGPAEPELVTVPLSARARSSSGPGYGMQCCGGEVTLLLEPLRPAPVVVVFGIGHVGLELARLLVRQEIDLHLVDTRPAALAADRLAVLADRVARLTVHRVPLAPEQVLADLPRGAHVLVMTHDHAEDLAICDQALRSDRVSTIGLIGSRAKRATFQARLTEAGHPEGMGRIRCPVGIGGLPGKHPATLAVGIAAELLVLLGSGEVGHRPEWEGSAGQEPREITQGLVGGR